ncbi:hypothetical protein MRX96_057614 [Rhipicephalus microplus]
MGVAPFAWRRDAVGMSPSPPLVSAAAAAVGLTKPAFPSRGEEASSRRICHVGKHGEPFPNREISALSLSEIFRGRDSETAGVVCFKLPVSGARDRLAAGGSRSAMQNCRTGARNDAATAAKGRSQPGKGNRASLSMRETHAHTRAHTHGKEESLGVSEIGSRPPPTERASFRHRLPCLRLEVALRRRKLSVGMEVMESEA